MLFFKSSFLYESVIKLYTSFGIWSRKYSMRHMKTPWIRLVIIMFSNKFKNDNANSNSDDNDDGYCFNFNNKSYIFYILKLKQLVEWHKNWHKSSFKGCRNANVLSDNSPKHIGTNSVHLSSISLRKLRGYCSILIKVMGNMRSAHLFLDI